MIPEFNKINQNFAKVAREMTAMQRDIGNLRSRIVNAPLVAGRHVTTPISSGIISVTAPHVLLEPETGTTDNLDTIEGGADGKIILLSLADPGDTITIRDMDVSGGNIDLHSNGYVLDHINASCVLYFNGTTDNWHLFGIPLLDDLRNVNIDTPTADHYLGYDASGDWVNRQINYSELDGAPPGGFYPGDEYIEDLTADQFTGNSGRVQASYDDGTGAITLILTASAANKYLYSTGVNTWAEGDITAFIRGLLDDADAATARTTLGISVYDQETAEDVTGAMVSGNTETGISVTYNDTTGKLNFDAQTAGDARYVLKSGDTMTGDLIIQGTLNTAVLRTQNSRYYGSFYNGGGEARLIGINSSDHVYVGDVDGSGGSLFFQQGGASRASIESGVFRVLSGDFEIANSGSQSYFLDRDGDVLFVEAGSAGANNIVRFTTEDADASDYVGIELWGRGKLGSTTNRERLAIRFDPTVNEYLIWSEQAGSGTLRPINIYAGTNTDQLYIDPNGNVGINTDTPGSRLAVRSNTLDFASSTIARVMQVNRYNSNTAAWFLGSEDVGSAPYNAVLVTNNANMKFGSGFFDAFTPFMTIIGQNGAGNYGSVLIGPNLAGSSSDVRLGVQAGASSNDAGVGGTLYTKYTTTGNVGGGDDTLFSYTVPADTLSENGQGIHVVCGGRVTNNGNAKTLTLTFGSAVIAVQVMTGYAAIHYSIEAWIWRKSSTTITYFSKITYNGGVTTTTTSDDSAGVTHGSPNALRLGAVAVSNDDLVVDNVRIAWFDTNT